MKYKALILDLDDTTVVHGKENLPSPKVTAAIAKARSKIHICVATARTLWDTKPILKHLALSGPCVLNNGTQIYDPVAKRMIKEILLPDHAYDPIIAIGKRYNTAMKICDGKKESLYVSEKRYARVLSIYFPEIEREKLDTMEKELQAIPGVDVHKADAWDRRFMSLDVSNGSASKLHGIVEVAKILGVQTHEIIGVGDGYNDFALLMACGLKIAMGNAVPELKTIADFVAPTVQEDGVATVIEKFVLAA